MFDLIFQEKRGKIKSIQLIFVHLTQKLNVSEY
jgi:hypothetical protein